MFFVFFATVEATHIVRVRILYLNHLFLHDPLETVSEQLAVRSVFSVYMKDSVWLFKVKYMLSKQQDVTSWR